jgi:hypothetical protein
MVCPPMPQRNGEVRVPVPRTGGAEGQEHGLEEGAALVSAFQLFGGDVETPHLQPQALAQLVRAAILAQAGEVLVQQRLA